MRFWYQNFYLTKKNLLKEIVQEYLFILITEGKEAQQISLEYFSKLDKIKLWLRSVQKTSCFLPVGDIYNIFGCSPLDCLSMFEEFPTIWVLARDRVCLSL